MPHIICPRKIQWATTLHLLEWPKSRTLVTPNAGKDMKLRNFHMLVGKTVTFENCPYNTKHTLSIHYSKCPPCHLLKWVRNLCSHKNLHRFMETVFIIAKIKKKKNEKRCAWAAKCINMPWYTQTMEYYSALKRKVL